MLSHVTVRDFAIVETLELELGHGMTVLTGETGAGKSILIDALGLVLGGRASASQVRDGAARAEVVAVFELDSDGRPAAWLRERELEEPDGECIVRRTVSAEGRSRAYVNARPVPAQQLRQLGELLIDIHGQHEHQSLLRPAAQRELLDAYARNGELLTEAAAMQRRWTTIGEERAALGDAMGDREVREDFLRFQIEELTAAIATPEEIAALGDEHTRLAHAGELVRAAEQALACLVGEDGDNAANCTGAAARALEPARALDERAQAIGELIEGARIQLEEAGAELRRYRDGIEIAPERLAELDTRLAALHDLARKHRVRPEELQGLLAELEGQLEASERSAERLAELDEESNALLASYRDLAARLGARRREAGTELAAQVTANMAVLGMEGGRLEVQLVEEPLEQPRAHGAERVQLLVCTNPGQPPQPLTQVASGGELSRLSLAIQVVGNQDSGIRTLIFDEVDTGVGGRLAEKVGRELQRLGESRQVLCVTHLPQVASQAHQHVQVSKRTGGHRTWTSVVPLADEERVMELARMLGGEEITQQTVAHAREMLGRESG